MARLVLASIFVSGLLVACGGDDASLPQGNQGGTAGAGGSAGNAGSAGAVNGGSSGTANGGSAGTANGGSAGTANGGSAGTANGGSAGTANGGSAGTANGGSAGTANGGSAGTANGGSTTGGSAGAAGSGGCEAGYADCSAAVAGCETPTDSDPDHCGGCDPCGTTNVATRTCAAGSCVLVCANGYEDCNGDPSDGCEVNLNADADHCGSCSNVCGSDGVATRTCAGGQCTPTCSSGRDNCDGNGDNGCEVTLATNSSHCGACGHACSSLNTTAVSCSAGACNPTCASTHGDCSTPPSSSADNGCETDLRTASNCGECGHSCLGGACGSSQRCDPLTLTSGLSQVGGMTVDGSSVYYTVSPASAGTGSVRKVSVNGGAATTLVSSLTYPRGIQVSGSYVYYAGGFLDASYINRVGTTGSGPTTLYNAGANRGAEYIQLWSNNLYWIDPRDQNAYRMAITGGNVAKMNTSGSANISEDVASDGSYLYSMDYAKVLSRMSQAGGAITNLAVPSGPSAKLRIAVDTSHVYYTDDSEIWRITKAGGTAERVVTHASTISSLALDGSYVYYIADNGVFRAAKGAGSTELTLWLGSTSAVDAEILNGALYWVGSAAMKLALP